MTKPWEFKHQEAQEGKKNIEYSLQDIEARLGELNDYLKDEISYLEVNIYRLKSMEQYNSFVDEMKLDKGVDTGNDEEGKNKYSKKDIIEINQEIKTIQDHIQEVKNHIFQYTDLKEDSKNLINQFNQLENELKAFLTTVRPEQNQ